MSAGASSGVHNDTSTSLIPPALPITHKTEVQVESRQEKNNLDRNHLVSLVSKTDKSALRMYIAFRPGFAVLTFVSQPEPFTEISVSQRRYPLIYTLTRVTPTEREDGVLFWVAGQQININILHAGSRFVVSFLTLSNV